MVTALLKNNYQTVLEAGSHRYVADESVASGGDDAGMSPTQLLLCSLASCTSITIKMYANRKAWPLDAVHVSVNMISDTTNGADAIIREIDLTGNLDTFQKERLLYIANHCPVHKILSKQNLITTNLK
jgi:putative redox protein